MIPGIKVFSCLFTVILLSFNTIWGQKALIGEDFFYTFELPNGVLGNNVQAIHQDAEGLLWFGSVAGLIRYDGCNFKTFQYGSVNDANSYVECIYETKDSILWLGTWGSGLKKYDIQKDAFSKFQATGHKNTLTDNYVTAIVADHDGFLWVATRNGLNRINRKTGNIQHFFHDENDANSLSSNVIRALYVDSQGTLWIGTGSPWDTTAMGGLNRYHPEKEYFSHYKHNPNDPNSISNNKVSAIFEDSHHNFWIGTAQNRIHLMDRKTGTFAIQSELSDFENTKYYTNIRSFTEDADGYLWICSYGSGIKQYDKKTHRVIDYYYHEFKNEYYGNNINPINLSWSMFQSADGTKWICTGGEGKAVLKSKKTFPYLHTGMPDQPTLSLFKNKKGKLWLGKKAEGVHQINLKDHSRRFYYGSGTTIPGKMAWANNFDFRRKDVLDNIHFIYEENDSTLWMSKAASGLIRLDTKREKLSYFRHQPNNEKSISGDKVVDIADNKPKNELWIATETGALCKMDKSTHEFEQFTPDIYPNCPKNPTKLLLTKDQILWMGHIEQQKKLVLSRLDTKTNTFTNYELAKIAAADTSFKITNIVENALGEIWLGTNRSLSKLHPQTGIITHYPFEPYRLPSCKSMLIDDKNNIWLATSSGMSVFDPTTATVFTLPPAYKIEGAPYSFRAAFKGDKGTLFFGGQGGCLYLDSLSQQIYYSIKNKPKTLQSSSILITEYSLNRKKQAIRSLLAAHSTPKLKLKHDENIFSFQFSLLDFNAPDLNRFEFQLENYDKYWRKAEKNTASYSHVPPGQYIFRVKGYNYAGEWGESPPIFMTILAPWWKSWWAYILYSFCLLAILYSIYRFQLQRKLTKEEARRLKELDVEKTQLYTNITHEFRTPITVILGMAKQLKNMGHANQKESIETIDRNSHQLLNLINQLLDLSKLESKKMDLQLQQSDSIAFIQSIVDSFQSLAQHKLKIHFLSEVKEQFMDFDPNKLKQIISNLVSNAIKFTPKGGDIYIIIKKIDEPCPYLSINIKDTGIGIAPQHLPHIFKRFYQIDNSNTKEQQGTGIGLALVQELTLLMKGQIEVESELNNGTTFILQLPITQSRKKVEHSIKMSLPQMTNTFSPLTSPLPQENDEHEFSTILIVEDNADMRKYIQSFLHNAYQIIAAADGQEGINKALEYMPDLIISDVMMPKKDGYTLCHELKNDERSSHIPIILLTAKADTPSKLEGLKQGADAYLSKPFNEIELQLTISKLLELRTKLRQHYLNLITQPDKVAKNIPQNQDTTQIGFEDEFVLKVQAIIIENLANSEFGIEQLCKTIRLSHSHLHKKLTTLTGLSTNRFIRHIRLHKAKELLQNPAISITSVAFDVGFNDPAYFARVFKKEIGVTPSEWQQRNSSII